MRFVAMQVLTWGTIAGSVGSALLMAWVEGPPAGHAVDAPALAALPAEPTRAGPTDRLASAEPARGAASAPRPSAR